MKLCEKCIISVISTVLQTMKNVAGRWMDLMLRDVPQHRVMWLQSAGVRFRLCRKKGTITSHLASKSDHVLQKQ